MNPALHSSKKDTWGTPQLIRDAVYAFAPMDDVHDPCPGDTPVGAYLLNAHPDGLVKQWPANGVVYVNSPYGTALKHWVNKCAVEAAGGCEIIALVTARPDTRWFAQALNTSQSLCLISGRLTFMGAQHPAPFPSCLFYWGIRARRFNKIFGPLGNIVIPLNGGSDGS